MSRPESPLQVDVPSTIAFTIGAALLGAGSAAWLGSALGFPGAHPVAGVVGQISVEGIDKGRESGFFYYSLVLVPLFAAAGWLLASGATRRHGNGIAIMIAGLAAVIPVGHAMLDGSRGFLECVAAPFVLLAVGLCLTRVLASIPPKRFRKHLTDLLSGSSSTIACGTCVAIFALSVGPRIPADLSLPVVGARLCGVLLASMALVFGISWAAQVLLGLSRPTNGSLTAPPVSKAMRHGLWLALARFAPDSAVLVAAALLLAVVGFSVALFKHSRGRESAPSADDRSAANFFAFRFLPVLVLVLVFHHDVNGQIDFYHMGEWLTPASEMSHGEVPYRDFYLQHGLVQNALRSYVTFSLGDGTFETDRMSVNLMFAAAHAAFLIMLLVLLRSRVLAVLLALALASPGLYLSPRFMGMFIALTFVAMDIRRARDEAGRPVPRQQRWPLLAAGAACGVSLFWSLDSGIYAILSIVVFLLLEMLGRRGESLWLRIRPLVWLAYGTALGALPFLIYLGRAGALRAFARNSLDQIQLQMSVWGVPYPPLAEVQALIQQAGIISALGDGRVVALISAMVYIGTPAVLLIMVIRGHFTRTCFLQLLLVLAGANLFRTALGRSDAGHLAYVAAFLWPMLALAAETSLKSWSIRIWSASASAALRSLPALAFAAYLIGTHAPLYGMAKQWIRLSEARPDRAGGGFSYAPLPRMGDVLVPDVQARALISMASYFDDRLEPREPILDFSNMGAIYFFLDRDCPTRFIMPVYAATPVMQREMIADLESNRPRFLVTSDLLGMDPVDGIPMSDRLPLVTEYLMTHYQFHSDEAFGTVYELR